jgi:hypothetical protein
LVEKGLTSRRDVVAPGTRSKLRAGVSYSWRATGAKI